MSYLPIQSSLVAAFVCAATAPALSAVDSEGTALLLQALSTTNAVEYEACRDQFTNLPGEDVSSYWPYKSNVDTRGRAIALAWEAWRKDPVHCRQLWTQEAIWKESENYRSPREPPLRFVDRGALSSKFSADWQLGYLIALERILVRGDNLDHFLTDYVLKGGWAEVLLTHGDEATQVYALKWIGSRGQRTTKPIVPLLTRKIWEFETGAEKDPAKALAAIEALRNLWQRGSGALPTLERAIDNPSLRTAACSAHCQISGDSSLATEVLVAELASGTESRQEAAAETLARLYPRATTALPALIPLLQSDSTNLLLSTVHAIGVVYQDARPAVPGLVQLIQKPDTDPKVIEAALVALGRMGPNASAAIPALMELLEHPHDKIRLKVIETLGNVGPEAGSATPQLVALLNAWPIETPYFAGMKEVCRALGQIGGDGVPALTAALETVNHMSRHLIEDGLKQDVNRRCVWSARIQGLQYHWMHVQFDDENRLIHCLPYADEGHLFDQQHMDDWMGSNPVITLRLTQSVPTEVVVTHGDRSNQMWVDAGCTAWCIDVNMPLVEFWKRMAKTEPRFRIEEVTQMHQSSN